MAAKCPASRLTGPIAGSDATSIPDYGIVCEGEWNGARVLGVKLTFDKRYITLAPVATVIGLAFRMYDPDGLLGDKKRPRHHAGAGAARHRPAWTSAVATSRSTAPFQNGPIHGKDVFVPLSQLIGGEDYVGQGWRMLVECLSIGRSITLPSTVQRRVQDGRRGHRCLCAHPQAVRPVDRPLRRRRGSAGAHRRQRLCLQRAVAKPPRPRSIAAKSRPCPRPSPSTTAPKWRAQTARDVMDILGGKGVILGPRNFVGRGWQAAPISITVEGANIMTRSLMIFGQGAIRCHPWVLKEMQAAQHPDPKAAPARVRPQPVRPHRLRDLQRRAQLVVSA